MARLCPACARPNADIATQCLYCSEPLEAVVEATHRVAEPLPAGMDVDRHLIILVPVGVVDESKVASLARMARISPYEARLSLQSTRPRLFRSVAGEMKAREFSADLATSGIRHYVIAENEVRSLPIARARRAQVHERHLEASLDGTNLSIPYGVLLLVVRGEITRERHSEKRMDTTRGASRDLSPGLRLHLYSRDASVALEIDPENFDWSLLGLERTNSALLNLERFLDIVQEKAPSAALDRGFDFEPVVLSRSEASDDLAQMLSGHAKGKEGVVHDNEAQFRFYARWRYRLECQLARARN